jgi:hypothetical protein
MLGNLVFCRVKNHNSSRCCAIRCFQDERRGTFALYPDSVTRTAFSTEQSLARLLEYGILGAVKKAQPQAIWSCPDLVVDRFYTPSDRQHATHLVALFSGGIRRTLRRAVRRNTKTCPGTLPPSSMCRSIAQTRLSIAAICRARVF